jgi:hypothetical protein
MGIFLEGFATNHSLSLSNRWSWTGPTVSPQQRHQIKKLELKTLFFGIFQVSEKSQHFFHESGVHSVAACDSEALLCDTFYI